MNDIFSAFEEVEGIELCKDTSSRNKKPLSSYTLEDWKAELKPLVAMKKNGKKDPTHYRCSINLRTHALKLHWQKDKEPAKTFLVPMVSFTKEQLEDKLKDTIQKLQLSHDYDEHIIEIGNMIIDAASKIHKGRKKHQEEAKEPEYMADLESRIEIVDDGNSTQIDIEDTPIDPWAILEADKKDFMEKELSKSRPQIKRKATMLKRENPDKVDEIEKALELCLQELD